MFLIHLKNLLLFLRHLNFLNFLLTQGNGRIKKLRKISYNEHCQISKKSKSNQTLNFVKLTQYNVRNLFCQKIMQKNEADRLVTDLFLFFEKNFI